jgi:hypothetical protein
MSRDEEEDRLKRIEAKLDEIHLAMTGNEELGIPGIFRRLAKVEEWIDLARVRLACVAALVSASGLGAWEALKAWFTSGGHER